MQDKILDKIFKLARNQKEVLYDNFEQVCKIVGIKLAQTVEPIDENIQDDSFEEEKLEENFLLKSKEYVEKLSKNKDFLKKIKSIINSENAMDEADKADNESSFIKAQNELDDNIDDISGFIFNFIKLDDSLFYDELFNYQNKDLFVLSIISDAKSLDQSELDTTHTLRQVSYDDYIGVIASQIDQSVLLSFIETKKKYDTNPKIQKEYISSVINTFDYVKKINEKIKKQNPQYEEASKTILDAVDFERKKIILENISSKLGILKPLENTMEEEYSQEREFTPTGEPYKNSSGELIQIYGKVWPVPIESEVNENGELVPVFTNEIDEKTGIAKQIPIPKIEIRVVSDLHNLFLSKYNFEDKARKEEEIILDVRSIYQKYFGQEKYDFYKNKILSLIYKEYSVKNPQKLIENGLDPSRDFNSYSKDQSMLFSLSISKEDINTAISKDPEINSFFENINYTKKIIKDLSGYAVRVKVASQESIDESAYNYILEFCEKYYGKHLENLNNTEFYDITELITMHDLGTSFGPEIDEGIDQINERVVKKLMDSGDSEGNPLSFKEALGILSGILKKDIIVYLKNIKDRAESFITQQELSHGINFTHSGASQFCKFCGRFRGITRDTKKTDTGMAKIKGIPYFITPEIDKEIKLSTTDSQSISPENLEKYFDKVGDEFVQKKCDYDKQTQSGSCDIVDSFMFKGISKSSSINMLYDRNIPAQIEGTELGIEIDGNINKILLNNSENELIQSFSKRLLSDNIEGIERYWSGKKISILKPFEEQSENQNETEEVTLDKETIKNAFIEYLNSTSTSIQDALLSRRSKLIGKSAVKNSISMKRSSRILFHALQSYNSLQYNFDEEKSKFMAGTDLMQLFACGSYFIGNQVLDALGIKKGKKYNIDLITDQEKKLTMRDPSGNLMKSEENLEKDLSHEEFLENIKIPFGSIDFPSEDHAAISFIYMNRTGTGGYSSKVSNALSFADKIIKKTKALDIYKEVQDILLDDRISFQNKQIAIEEAWEKVKENIGYKNVQIPEYKNKPTKYIEDPKTKTLILNPYYEQMLSNWIRKHFVDGEAKFTEEELAFYSADSEDIANSFISIMNEVYSTFDFDMPYKGTSTPTDTDIEVFTRQLKNIPALSKIFTPQEIKKLEKKRKELDKKFFDDPDFIPNPLRGDLIFDKKTKKYFIVLDYVEKSENFKLLPVEVFVNDDFEEEYKVNSLEDIIYYNFPKISKFKKDSFSIYPGKGIEILEKNSSPVSVLSARFQEKYAYTGSEKDSVKFASAGLVKWMDQKQKKGINLNKLLEQTFGENSNFYKELYKQKNDLNFFSNYYSLYKFVETLKVLKDSNITDENLGKTALEKLHKELKKEYSKKIGTSNLRTDNENIALLKQRIYKDLIQRSVIDSVPLEEFFNSLNIPKDFFGNLEDYIETEKVLGGALPDYLPFFAPKITTEDEYLKSFNKGSIASTFCPTGEGKDIDEKYNLSAITGYDVSGEKISEQEKLIIRRKAFTSMTEKIMKLSLLDKTVCSKLYDYLNEMSSKGCFIVAFTPKINQILGILSLNMFQNPKRSLNAERPVTISQALVMYVNAYKGILPDREMGFPLGGSQLAFNEQSDPGTAGEFTSNMSPMQIAINSIPEWGLDGVSFSKGLNSIIQGSRIEGTSNIPILEKLKERRKSKANSNQWYKVAENKEFVSGNFSHVLITSNADLTNCVKNSQMTKNEDPIILPFVKVVPYENFKTIERIIDFKNRTGYNAVILSDSEYDFLNKIGLIP